MLMAELTLCRAFDGPAPARSTQDWPSPGGLA